MSLLSVKNLSVSFKNEVGEYIPAVSNVSFDLDAGEILGIVGESGSGKSVTALSILKLLPYPKAKHSKESSVFYTEGNLLTCSDEILRNIRGKEIAYIFQEPMSSLNPLHTIGKQLIENIKIHSKINTQKAYIKALDLLKQVELSHPEERMKAYPHELSGGQRQRVMIAMAISNRPKILIADEPTTALDVTVQAQIIDLLLKLCKQMKMAMIFISHNLRLVEKIADKICVMQAGKIVEEGSTGEIFNHPKHSYTQKLLETLKQNDKEIKDVKKKNTLLTTEDLYLAYPLKKNIWGKPTKEIIALNNVELKLFEGETLGVVGESGSGKTTLGLCLADLCKYQGIIRLGNQDIKEIPPKTFRKKVQIVFQDPYNSLNPRMNIEQIIGEGLNVFEKNITKNQKDKKIIELLKKVDLQTSDRFKYPHEFSGGQRQRIAIARALAVEPEILILDEPTSALDVTIQKQILELLKKLQKENHLSYVFISHDMYAVKEMADRIAVMKDGKIIEINNASIIFEQSTEKYTRELIKSSTYN